MRKKGRRNLRIALWICGWFVVFVWWAMMKYAVQASLQETLGMVVAIRSVAWIDALLPVALPLGIVVIVLRWKKKVAEENVQSTAQ